MSDDDKKNLRNIKPIRPSEMAFFELVDPQDLDYSNIVEFFDNIPKFVDCGKTRYWSYNNVKPTISTEYRIAYNGREKVFVVTLQPGRIKRKKDGKYEDVLVYPSIQREEVVYDGLRKLANSGYGGFYDNDLGASFTFYMLQMELKKYGKTFSIDEIKESLWVLRTAGIHIKSLDGAMEWVPSYLANMVLATRQEYLECSSEARCHVAFDTLVSSSVQRLAFREYNYAIAQSTKNPIAKYLMKRMDRRFKQASSENCYEIKLSTVFNMIFKELDPKMSNNTRHMNAAFKVMMEKRRIKDVKAIPIKSDRDARKTVDYLYQLFPHAEMIKDAKRFNAKYNALPTIKPSVKEKEPESL